MNLAQTSNSSRKAARRCRNRTWVVIVAATLSGCFSKQSSVTLLGPGIINDPKNKSLRVDILKFGLESFCSEMTARGVALKLSDDHPVAGRFFAKDCKSDMLEDGDKTTFHVKFAGSGYVWSNVTRRVGFEVLGSVELLPDFQVAKDKSMYVYFRSHRVETTQLKVTLLESKTAQAASSMTGLDADKLAREIFEAQVSRGFTVIRANESGQIDYALGLLPVGKRPYHPFTVSSENPILANDRTEIHSGQQDYVGGLTVPGDDKALSVVLLVDGAPSVNYALISATGASQMLDRYVHVAGVAGFSEPARFTQNVPFGSMYRQTIPVPAGNYVLMFEHAAGPPAPGSTAASDDRAAKVDYFVELVDAP